MAVQLTHEVPVLAVEDSLVFPHVAKSMDVTDRESIAAAEAAWATGSRHICVIARRSDGLFGVGTDAVITRFAGKPPRVQLIIQGLERARIEGPITSSPYLRACIRRAPIEPLPSSSTWEAMERTVIELSAKVIAARPDATIDLLDLTQRVHGNARIYTIAAMLGFNLEKEQALLEAETAGEALEILHRHLAYEAEVLELKERIQKEAKSELTREQREYLLRQQMRIIKRELEQDDPAERELGTLTKKLEELPADSEVRLRAEQELSRLERLSPMSPEHAVLRGYCECLLELPWGKTSGRPIDLRVARAILDEDHYGLEDVKSRVLEHLAVLKLNSKARAPILCFEGPPGVGKTSLGQSIARALGRKFERISLGGLHDEAELRGHRRTYVGAMPGRVIQALRHAEASDPVLLLDEIDKVGRDFRSDPTAALLEILDPEQNSTFRDNYLDLPFDLSKIIFLTTANNVGPIPRPLLDRMEVIRLSGYSEEEKLIIAKKYLVPKQLREAGLYLSQLKFDDQVLARIIDRFTREAGARQLERAIARIARKVALKVAEGATAPAELSPDDLPEILGREVNQREERRSELPPGVAVGLAWTEGGGDVIHVETALLPTGSALTMTGQLGEVMQESARAAQTFVWSHAVQIGIDVKKFQGTSVHLHVPSGSIPKDGPSAGVTMVAAIASAYLGRSLRADTAMTGEITLSGLVLAVGGVKEKILAARRAGLRRVIIPKANARDLKEIPDEVKNEVEVVMIESVEEIFDLTLVASRAEFCLEAI